MPSGEQQQHINGDEDERMSASMGRLSSSAMFTDELMSVLSPHMNKGQEVEYNFPIATGIGEFNHNL